MRQNSLYWLEDLQLVVSRNSKSRENMYNNIPFAQHVSVVLFIFIHWKRPIRLYLSIVIASNVGFSNPESNNSLLSGFSSVLWHDLQHPQPLATRYQEHPHLPPPTNYQKCCQTLPCVPWGENYLWFKTTALVSEVEATDFVGRLERVIHMSYIYMIIIYIYIIYIWFFKKSVSSTAVIF